MDCKGQNRQQGEIASDTLRGVVARWVLLGENDTRIKLSDALGDVGTILIEVDLGPAAKPPTTARGLRESDEITLELMLGAACSD